MAIILFYDIIFFLRTFDIVIPQAMIAKGTEEYMRPQTPFMTIKFLRRSPNGTTGSVKGTVTTVSLWC